MTGSCCTAPTPSTALRTTHHAPGHLAMPDVPSLLRTEGAACGDAHTTPAPPCWCPVERTRPSSSSTSPPPPPPPQRPPCSSQHPGAKVRCRAPWVHACATETFSVTQRSTRLLLKGRLGPAPILPQCPWLILLKGSVCACAGKKADHVKTVQLVAPHVLYVATNQGRLLRCDLEGGSPQWEELWRGDGGVSVQAMDVQRPWVVPGHAEEYHQRGTPSSPGLMDDGRAAAVGGAWPCRGAPPKGYALLTRVDG